MVFATEVDKLLMFVTEFNWMTEGAKLLFAMEFRSTVFIKEGDSTSFDMEVDDIHAVFVDTIPEGTVGVIWLYSSAFVEIIIQGTKEGKDV